MAIEVVPGDTIGATIGFTFRGPAVNLWVGFGLTDDKSRPPYVWIGSMMSLAAAADWVAKAHTVQGTLPRPPVSATEEYQECCLLVATGAPSLGTFPEAVPGLVAGPVWTGHCFRVMYLVEIVNLSAEYFVL